MKYLTDHGLEGCTFAREVIVGNLAGLGDVFLRDRVPNAINQVGPEYMAKAAYAGLQSFHHCREIEDWRRPRNHQAAQGWSSKVYWDLYIRLNPRAEDSGMKMHRELEEEIRKGRAHDVAVKQFEEKMQGSAKDFTKS